MFKGARETKEYAATESVPDVITGPDGLVYRRADYEDAERPGVTKAGRLYSPAELQACGKWGLVSPSGFSFAAHLPLPIVPDPTHVGREDVPAPLRETASKAWEKLNEVRALIAAAHEKRTQAEEAQGRAVRRGDKVAYNRAVAAAMQAEEERLAVETEEPPLRMVVSRAEEAIACWCRDEGLYLCGAVTRPEPSAGIF